MYLSRIQLTPVIANSSQLGLILKDQSYGMHRLLWDLLTDKSRFLFREESASEQGQAGGRFPLYYVLSQAPPVTNNPLFEVDSKVFAPVLNVGDQLAFKIRANPTVARKTPGRKNSKRHDVLLDAQRAWLIEQCRVRDLAVEGKKSELKQALLQHADFYCAEEKHELSHSLKHVAEEAALQWLQSRGENNGYALQSTQATGYQWRALPEKGRQAGFSSMDYEGVLTVTDVEAFLQMLHRGLGPSKGFGCGLMLIRRV